MSKSVKVRVKGKKGMIAIFMAIVIKVILSFALIEYTENNIKQINIMRTAEDRVKAKYLALSGVNFSILFLQIQKMIVDPINKKVGYNLQIWQQVPLSSDLLAMFMDKEGGFVKSMMGEEKYSQLKMEEAEKNIDNEKEEKEPALDSDGNPIVFERRFNFDGDFNAEITDETSKFNLNLLRGSKARIGKYQYQLTTLFSQPEYLTFFESERENDTVIPPEEVVASITDWVDKDDERSGINGGSEDERYSYLKHKYHNKNDRFTSLDELYMVYGIDDDFMEVFKDSLTIYGESKININSCDETILRTLIYGLVDDIPPSYMVPHSPEMAQLISDILEYRRFSPFTNAKGFYSLLNSVEGIKVSGVKKRKFNLVTDSTIFKIVSYGVVEDATFKIETVIDSTKPEAQYLYYREE